MNVMIPNQNNIFYFPSRKIGMHVFDIQTYFPKNFKNIAQIGRILKMT